MNEPVETDSEKLIIGTCGRCSFCSDGGPDPQNPVQHIYNCHVDPPKANIIGMQGGTAVMSIRPTVQENDLSCERYLPKDALVPPLDS